VFIKALIHSPPERHIPSLLLATFRVVVLKYGLKNNNITFEVEKGEIPEGVLDGLPYQQDFKVVKSDSIL
jgi:hypothetical protein